jgi:hypothetical protein
MGQQALVVDGNDSVFCRTPERNHVLTTPDCSVNLRRVRYIREQVMMGGDVFINQAFLP